ncbi:unnamed protein product [Arabis nemorensis]|uniref:Leucine-rich repeat-containing N-terminal plant-type domain-containing protein n=1 Tax=Arabis nemorensis TaxID=586526 RepID=A0A565B388_9BRAS|nr:unnamed protein product [Arabis nemorensis]
MDLTLNEFNNSIFPFLNAATSLTTLFLRDNNIDGLLPELKDLTNLELLDLSSNKFNGSIPIQELTALKKLKVLDLSGNELSGSMELKGVCELKNIEELDLSKDNLVGQFPLCLTSLTGLRVLDLSSNQLTGNLPADLGKLEFLEYLSLFDSDFEGFFSFGSIAKLSMLKVVKIYSRSNLLKVEVEGSWEPNFQLTVIVLRSCKLEKLSPTEIFSWPAFPEFNHMLPENIGWILPHLRYLNLANNGFQGNLPSSLGNNLSHNSFQGKLPRSVSKGCYSMTILKLSHNKLSGEIFQESVHFTDINVLSMDHNQFTGKIGQGLYMLDISNNNLTGVIPSWFDELSSLSALLVSNNLLEGEIPISLFNMPSLWILDLSANFLSGDIPPLVNSRTPIVLLLQDNNLSGVIPETLLGNVTIQQSVGGVFRSSSTPKASVFFFCGGMI